MYYYAYIDSNSIAQGVYALPTTIPDAAYVQITLEQYNNASTMVIGKYWNGTAFVNASSYYALLDCNDICEKIVSLSGTINSSVLDLISLSSNDTSLVGMKYNRTTNAFESAVVEVPASKVTVGNDTLEDVLSDMDTAISGKAATSHTHTEYASTSHNHNTAYSAIDHDHDSDYAALSHTHSGYASASDVLLKNNTTAFTPTANYHPATKKYVDDSMSSAGNGDMMKSVYDTDNDGSVNSAEYADSAGATTGTLTIQKNGTAVDTFNGSTNKAVNITVPTTASDIGAASSNHTHSEYATVTALEDAVADKAESTHTHSQSDITGLSTALDGKASANHTHTASDVGASPSNHTHTPASIGAATSDHTHSGYASSTHTHTASDVGAAALSHTHAQSDITGLTTALNGKASSSHTHSMSDVSGTLPISKGGTGATSASSALTALGAASSSHTHSGYASVNHTHSEYAGTSHNHSSLSGDVNITGAIRSNSVQVGYNSGSDTTLGSNSYPTNVAGTQVTLNGTKVYSPNIYPRNSGSFTLGAQSNRWTGIYSTVAVNVSSDERLKENIRPVDSKSYADFIDALEVDNFNYIGSEDDDRLGVIAQQLVKANPDIAKYITELGDDGYYGVRTSDLVFPLICAVQELSAKIKQMGDNK